MKSTPVGYLLEWEKTRSGWRSTPGGYSLHLTKADAEKYRTQYWESLGSELPAEYLRERGKPVITGLSAELAEALAKKPSIKFGVRQLRIRKLETGHLVTERNHMFSDHRQVA